MKRFLFLAVAVLISGFSTPKTNASYVPQFQDHPAQIYTGRVRAPNISSHPDASTYRTRIKNAAKGRVNFAGQYILDSWGCGANCLMGVVINARTGRVAFLPGTVCCWDVDRDSPMDYRTDSNLIIFNGLINEEEPKAKHYYEFRGGRFHFIQRQVAVASAPVPLGVRTPSSRKQVASSGADTDVTDFTLVNDLNFNFTVKWLDSNTKDVRSQGGEQTKSHPFVSPGQSWRVERGAKTWESHWFAIYSQQGFVCSFSPRQGETVQLSQLSACNSSTSGNGLPSVQPSCPSGYVFSGGQCVVDAAPTPSCPAGFEFKRGQCQRASTNNPPRVGTLQQCAARCDRVVGKRCDRELRRLGDAQSWDGDLRQGYWDDTCVPRVNACKVRCNPKVFRPGDCRYMADGSQVCS